MPYVAVLAVEVVLSAPVVEASSVGRGLVRMPMAYRRRWKFRVRAALIARIRLLMQESQEFHSSRGLQNARKVQNARAG